MINKLTKQQDSGMRAELLAKKYLKRKGLKPLATRYSCKLGEIDLIMREHNTIVAVEVKYRSSPDYGGAISAISSAKINKVKKTLLYFCGQKNLLKYDMRIDAITIEREINIANLTWLQNITI